MLALTLASVWVVLVTPPTTHLCMPMTNAASTNADVFDTIIIPACDGGISLGLGDQVAQQGAGAEEAQADVGGLCEVSQHWRVGEVSGPWPTVNQRNHNLSILQRDNFRVFCGAELVIIM